MRKLSPETPQTARAQRWEFRGTVLASVARDICIHYIVTAARKSEKKKTSVKPKKIERNFDSREEVTVSTRRRSERADFAVEWAAEEICAQPRVVGILVARLRQIVRCAVGSPIGIVVSFAVGGRNGIDCCEGKEYREEVSRKQHCCRRRAKCEVRGR